MVWLSTCLVSLATLLPVSGLQLGSRSAEEWVRLLDRERRVSRLKIKEVVARLRLKPGDVVADLGAGSGVFSAPLAQAVAPTGQLLAVDIDQGLLDHIDKRAKEFNIKNIQTVLGQFEDPSLPRRDVDVAFFHDVLHHIEKRHIYLKNLISYLRPGARVVVIDLIKGHPNAPHQDQPEMQITVDELKQWMAALGFELREEFDLFENKFFAVFARR